MVIFEPGILTISIAIGLTGRTYMARIVRGKMLQLRDQEFTLALSGSWQVPPRVEAPHTQLPRAHNNLRDVHHTRCDLRRVVPQLYRARHPETPGLARVPDQQRHQIHAVPSLPPWFPTAILILIMISYTLFGDSLYDAFDPRMRKKGGSRTALASCSVQGASHRPS